MIRIGHVVLSAAVMTTACTEPSVVARAVWIDDVPEVDGSRQLRIYDAGHRRTLTLRAATRGAIAPEHIDLQLGPSGRGVVVSGPNDAVYFDLDDSRQVALPRELPDQGFEPMAAPTFLRHGDALMIRYAGPDDTVAAIGVLPLDTVHEAEPLVHELDERFRSQLWTLEAGAASIVVLAERADAGPCEQAQCPRAIEAVGYEEINGTADLVALGSGSIPLPTPEQESEPSEEPDEPVVLSGWCPYGFCVDPSGETVIALAEPGCAIWRWAWRDAAAADAPVDAGFFALPAGCPTDTDLTLVGVLGADHVLAADEDRFYLFDLERDETLRAPALGDVPQVLFRDGGRVALAVTRDGPVLRIDASGPRLLSTERTACDAEGVVVDPTAGPHRVVASPNGGWLAWTCSGGLFESEGGYTAGIVRVSALGLERFDGIAMRPLAVDDRGAVLLYSIDPDDVNTEGASLIPDPPRGLFVLAGDGSLLRVDDLEPSPAYIGTASDAFFAAAPL